VTGRILIVDDEESIRFTFKSFLEEEGYEVLTVGGVGEARALLMENAFDLVFADVLLGDGTGIDILREVHRNNPHCPVVMFTGAPTVETSAEAVRLGAYDYIPKPVRQDTIVRVANMAISHKKIVDEKERYRANIEAIFSGIKDAILMIDMEGTVVEANEAVKDIIGCDRGEIIGKRYNDIGFCGSCRDIIEETLRAGRPLEAENIEHKNGNRPANVVSVSTSPLFDAWEGISGMVVVIKDETRLAALERQLNERKKFYHIIGKSPKMQEVYSLIESLSDVDSTVLITGESGTGKELVAEALHYSGIRCAGPLVKVNCSALMESLLESELFGHAKGAFTGAVSDRRGRFETAQGGTILLDEIGDISHALQLRMLRVLQNKEIERVGDSTPVIVDARVIVSTNKNLRDLMRAGKFREDLYYRIKVVEIHLPPLRERKEDIPLLVEHFLAKLGGKLKKKVESVSKDVMVMFMSHGWPGNIREMENILEHALIVCQKDVVTMEDLPLDTFESMEVREPLADYGNGVSRQSIIDALEKAEGNKSRAARMLGISRRTIYRKLKEFGIEKNGAEG
jgi:PAS domain S-box-containing protein